jgi:hypothetical protein
VEPIDFTSIFKSLDEYSEGLTDISKNGSKKREIKASRRSSQLLGFNIAVDTDMASTEEPLS